MYHAGSVGYQHHIKVSQEEIVRERWREEDREGTCACEGEVMLRDIHVVLRIEDGIPHIIYYCPRCKNLNNLGRTIQLNMKFQSSLSLRVLHV